MKFARIICQMARADFLERVRRYSFLVMLGLVVFLGYQTAIGNLSLELGKYRGEFNSAWVGAMMSLIASFFIGWFGFYLVKGSVARDRETGVGQIIATTPLTRPLYLLGKWLSNFAVLMAMVAVLALAGIVIQLLQGENTQINLLIFLGPFIYLVMPLMALVAATAVLFETIPFLQGGFGNVVYFFAFIAVMPFFLENETLNKYAAFEPLGLVLVANDMGRVLSAVHPDYSSGFSLGSSGEVIVGTFTWTGIPWTADVVLARFSLIGLAIGMTFLAALFFDRFDPSRTKPGKTRKSSDSLNVEAAAVVQIRPVVSLSPLGSAAKRFSFLNVLTAEVKLLVKGQRWWWYAVAAGLIIACFSNPSATTRELVLPLTWIWPILIWSAMGNREIHNNVQQLAFSSVSPLWRQLPAQWLAGFLVTLAVSSGAILRFSIDGDAPALLALLSGALFIPSLALAAGVWSGTSKVFEILYMVIWYLGPMNKIAELDYSGAHGSGRPEFFIPVSLALLALAAAGRAKQLRN